MAKRKPAPEHPALKIEYWPVDRLQPYERNPRRNDKAVGQMVASIKEYGFTIPVLAKSDGLVIDGHLRLKAAVQMKLAEVPVIPCDTWTEAQVKAFRLMVNRSVAWADWDMDALALEFLDLKALDFDLTMTGFDPSEWAPTEGAAAGTPGAIETAKRTLAERFGVPPFSVLDARQGYWQDRKRAWLALGIQSELGRGETSSTSARVGPDDQATYRTIGGRKANAIPGGGTDAVGSRKKSGGGASPGGSPRPAMKTKNGKTMRGDGRGRALVQP